MEETAVRPGRGARRVLTERSRQIADKEEKIEFEGEVVEALRSGMFRIKLDNGHETLGYTAGKMRRYRIRILPGDRVRVRHVGNGVLLEPIASDVDAWFNELDRFSDVPFFDEGRSQPPAPQSEDLFG